MYKVIDLGRALKLLDKTIVIENSQITRDGEKPKKTILSVIIDLTGTGLGTTKITAIKMRKKLYVPVIYLSYRYMGSVSWILDKLVLMEKEARKFGVKDDIVFIILVPHGKKRRMRPSRIKRRLETYYKKVSKETEKILRGAAPLLKKIDRLPNIYDDQRTIFVSDEGIYIPTKYDEKEVVDEVLKEIETFL